jgi:hypothetical protein
MHWVTHEVTSKNYPANQEKIAVSLSSLKLCRFNVFNFLCLALAPIHVSFKFYQNTHKIHENLF